MLSRALYNGLKYRLSTENERAQKHIDNKEIKKIIYIPGRILNVVV